MNNAYEFYKGRIESCPSYGFSEGHKILRMVTDCVFWDKTLTMEEYNSIIKLAYEAHIKLMEDNYNEGWS